MQELLLGLLERVVRRAQLLVGAAQLGRRAGDEHRADTAARRRGARRAVGVDRHAASVGGQEVQLNRLAAPGGAGIHQHRMRSRDAAGVRQQSEKGGAAQVGIAAADQFAQGRVRLLDLSLFGADQQHVRHGGQHAEDEPLRLLEFLVLLFEFDFVLNQLRVDLVHLLDHVQPGGVVHAMRRCPRAFGTARRHQWTVQTMHGSKERTMCCTETGVVSPSRTGAPSSALSSAPGVPAASRGEKFQVVGATIW